MPTSHLSEQSRKIPLALRGIPPFPAVAIQLLRTASNEFARLRELSDLIRADAAFSAGILRTANSSLYGLRTNIDSILQATLLLGLERVKAIVVTAAMKNYLGPLLDADWMRACWRHNLACAVIASELAGGTLVEEDAAYTAGLMHDMGRLALGVAYGAQYRDFLLNPTDISENILELENSLFGIDHCEAGSALAAAWELPTGITRVIARHHERTVSTEFDILAIVALACRVSDVLGFEAFRQPHVPTYVELRAAVPEMNRRHLPPEPADLVLRIASAINAIETA